MNIGRAIAVQSIRAVSGSDRRAFVDRLGLRSRRLTAAGYQGAYAT